MTQLHESDARLIALIRSSENLAETDPAPKLNTLNFLVFGDEAMATLAADEAVKLGWAIDNGPTKNMDSEHWHVALRGNNIEISSESVVAFRKELETLAGKYGGKFEYWGASQSPNVQANNPSRVFEPVSKEAIDFQESLRAIARETEIAGDPTSMTELFNSVFVEWINIPQSQRDPHPHIISVIAVALGDWITQFTDLEWRFMYEGPNETIARSSAPSLVLCSSSTDAVLFIFDAVAKRWGSRERLDDFAYGAVRQMRNYASAACADIQGPPEVIRLEPFDSVDHDFKNQALKKYKEWSSDYSPESIERSFSRALGHVTKNSSSQDIINSQNEALEALTFAFGEFLIDRLNPSLCTWATVYQADGTKFDAIATGTFAYPVGEGIAAFADKNGEGFAAYATAVGDALEQESPLPPI